LFSHAYLNKAAGQKFLTNTFSLSGKPEQECDFIIISASGGSGFGTLHTGWRWLPEVR